MYNNMCIYIYITTYITRFVGRIFPFVSLLLGGTANATERATLLSYVQYVANICCKHVMT